MFNRTNKNTSERLMSLSVLTVKSLLCRPGEYGQSPLECGAILDHQSSSSRNKTEIRSLCESSRKLFIASRKIRVKVEATCPDRLAKIKWPQSTSISALDTFRRYAIWLVLPMRSKTLSSGSSTRSFTESIIRPKNFTLVVGKINLSQLTVKPSVLRRVISVLCAKLQLSLPSAMSKNHPNSKQPK